MQILLRKDAIAAGLSTYETGSPCKHGHFAYRYTSSGACSECIRGNDTSKLRRATMPNLTDQRADDWQRRQELAAKLTAERDERKAEQLELLAQKQAHEAARKAGKAMLLRKKVMSPSDRWLDMRLIVITLTRLRCEQLTDDDIIPKNPYIGNFIYQVMIHPDDFETFQQVSASMRAEDRVKHNNEQLARPGVLSPQQSLDLVDNFDVPRYYDNERDTWILFNGHWYTRSDLLDVQYKDFARRYGVPQNPASYKGRKITVSDLEELTLTAENGYVKIGGDYYTEWDITRLQHGEVTHINAVLPL